MKAGREVSDAVTAEQVNVLFRQMPIALGVNVVNGGLTTIALVWMGAGYQPVFWFGVVALVTTGRWLLWRLHRRDAELYAGRWSALATCGSLIAGLSWGIGGALMVPLISPPGQLFLTIVIGGMCAGAVVLSISHLPTLVAFLLATSLPMAGRFFANGTTADSVLGAEIVVFVGALVLAGNYLNRIFAETMRLRFELNELNVRLQAEIAEHRETAASLRQAQKLEAIGQLTGGIAHDFNNLLTVVIGNLFLARGRTDQNSTIVPLLEGATQAAERGVALIQRLLGFARKQRLEPRSVDLRRLLSDIEGLLLRTLGPLIRLDIASDTDLPAVQVDANQLELAILNLTINAGDAMPNGGTLRIELTDWRAEGGLPSELGPGKYVVISFADTGTGMDKTTLARAFDPFFTTKEIGTGSGLGLPTVQGFAVQSGGAVEISSELGAGTTVTLWLPQAAEPAAGASGADQSSSEIAHGTAGILLCDDDDQVRRFLGDFLRSVGHTVHEAKDGEATLRVLGQETDQIDLLIVDYAMPGISGLETVGHALQRQPDLKTLLITGHAGAVRGSTAGVPILRKPFSPAELASKIAEILAA